MKIAYVTTYASKDIHAWSGLGYYILEALKNQGAEVECIGDLKRRDFICRVKGILYRKLLKKQYLTDREPVILRHYAKQVEEALRFSDADVVFCPGTIPIAYVKSNKPIVFWTDATFAGLLNFYPGMDNLCPESLRNGHQMEQMALTNATLAIYSSDWAAQTAIRNYDVSPDKVKVVPFGANVECNRTAAEIQLNALNKPTDVCKLLFVGVDWKRKGGEFAVKVHQHLHKIGINSELHIVGCEPEMNLPANVIKHGFLSKRSIEDEIALKKLFLSSHFFILPSRAECCAIALAEASSFGLPSLTTDVGGITTAITNKKNGQVFSLDSSPEFYCDFIQEYWLSKQKYVDLSLSSFHEYTTRLNWNVAGNKVFNLLKNISRA